MKKLSKILTIFGFSLLFSGLLGVATSSKKAEQARAEDPTFWFGNKDLFIDPVLDSADGFTGKAELEETENQYILHLDNFNKFLPLQSKIFVFPDAISNIDVLATPDSFDNL